jgi:hypothetical protein
LADWRLTFKSNAGPSHLGSAPSYLAQAEFQPLAKRSVSKDNDNRKWQQYFSIQVGHYYASSKVHSNS